MTRIQVSNQYGNQQLTTQARLVPLNNVAPISTFFNALTKDFPTTEKESD